jgi:hypothetical protein
MMVLSKKIATSDHDTIKKLLENIDQKIKLNRKVSNLPFNAFIYN